MHSYGLEANTSRWWVFHFRRIMVRGAGQPYPEDRKILMRDFESEQEAAAYCNYLNGGIGHLFGEKP